MNDGMGTNVVSQLIKEMIKKSIQIEGAKILVIGLAFKENCPDLRNTKVVDIVTELKEYNCDVDVYDPWINIADARREYGITPITAPIPNTYDAIIVGVAHNEFKTSKYRRNPYIRKDNGVFYDLKYLLKSNEVDLQL